MQFDFVFKNMSSSKRVKTLIEEKCQTLERFFSGKIRLRWTLSQEHNKHIVHVHVNGSSIDAFSEAEGEDLFSTIELALDKLSRQLQKKKEQVSDHHK